MINVICTVLSSCIDCLVVKKTSSINQKLRFLLDFKVIVGGNAGVHQYKEVYPNVH